MTVKTNDGKINDMKIALISDIHGNIPALEAVYKSILDKNISEIYNLGDSCYGPLWPEETAQFIIKNNIISIMGNGDEDLIKYPLKNETVKYIISQLSEKSINWIKNLPAIYENNDVTLFHGSPNNSGKYFLEKIVNKQIVIKSNDEIKETIKDIKSKYICFGHSHLERILKINDQILINAGSVGLPAYLENEPEHKIETFNNYAKYVIIENRNIEICNVEYDYKSSCKKAEENNRNDWSTCIKYGRIIE
ncbi:DNA methylase [Spirochaetia bacterium]|nr:DNA methylase [Spirochaetia bacterium]